VLGEIAALEAALKHLADLRESVAKPSGLIYLEADLPVLDRIKAALTRALNDRKAELYDGLKK
jgi:hypothetical protein